MGRDKRVRYAIEFTVLFIVYFVTAKISLQVYPGGQVLTALWPPAGIALAAILLIGYRVWPAIATSILMLNLTEGFSVPNSIILVAGNIAEPLLGAYLIKRFTNFDYSMERVRDVLDLIIFAAIISTVIGASIGVATLVLVGAIHISQYLKSWPQWWIGDLLGVLVITPFILIWSRQRLRTFTKAALNPVIIAVSLCLVAISYIVFHGFRLIGIKPFVLAYLIFPLLIWIAFRFRQIGSVNATFLVSIVAIVSTITSFSKFGTATITYQLLLLQTFLCTTAVTFMLIASGVNEREAHLQHKLALIARTLRLRKQKAQLIKLNKAKDDFISIASHQLRTPPTVIKQYLGMLIGGYAEKLSQDQNELAQRAYDSNEKQIKIISDILNVAQIDAGNVTLQQVDVNIISIIKEILEEKATSIAAHNLSVTFNYRRGRYMVYADPGKIVMVLENILDNACKYTPDGKTITVKLTKDKVFVAISIIDQGIGIAKKDSGKIFKKFVRIQHKSTSSTVDGTGIGLYWAKKIIVMHGGKISVTSKLHHGSTFKVSLPISPKVVKSHLVSRAIP